MQNDPSTIPIYHGRRWPVGIMNAAKRLGCTRVHLQKVLTGERKSQRITVGYAKLIDELNGRRPA